jgi:hypothetical protein
VAVVGDRPKFSINIVGVEASGAAKTTDPGPAISVIFTQAYDTGPVLDFLNLPSQSSKPDQSSLDFLDKRLKAIAALNLQRKGELYLQHYLFIGADLERICKEIVAEFDTTVLNPDRKAFPAAHDFVVQPAVPPVKP